ARIGSSSSSTSALVAVTPGGSAAAAAVTTKAAIHCRLVILLMFTPASYSMRKQGRPFREKGALSAPHIAGTPHGKFIRRPARKTRVLPRRHRARARRCRADIDQPSTTSVATHSRGGRRCVRYLGKHCAGWLIKFSGQ